MDNAKANSFYRKNGWKEMKRVFDEQSGVNKIIFAKRRSGQSKEEAKR